MIAGELMSPLKRLAYGKSRVAAQPIAAMFTVALSCFCAATAFAQNSEAGDSQQEFGSSQKPFGNTHKEFGISDKEFGNSQKEFGNSQKEFGNSNAEFVKDFRGSHRDFIKEFGFDADKSQDTSTPEEILAEKKRQAEALFKKKLQTAKLPETFDLAKKYHQVSDLEKAIAFYRLAITQDPKLVSAYNNLALCLIERKGTGDIDEAKEILAQSEKAAAPDEGLPKPDDDSVPAPPPPKKLPEDEKFFAMALASEQSEDLPKAVEYYQKVMALQQPPSLILINHLSALMIKMGNYTGARAVLKRGILSAPPEEHMKILYEALTNLDSKTKAN